MKAFRTAAVIAAFSASLLISPARAAGNDGDALYQVEAPNAFSMVGDLVIARPLLIAGTVLGTALFVVTLPFTAPVGAAKQSAQSLVVEPGRAAFVRCLGCTESGRYQDDKQ